MPTSTPMHRLETVGKFILFRAKGRHFKHEGLFLWTGKRHIQLWPLWRFGRSGD